MLSLVLIGVAVYLWRRLSAAEGAAAMLQLEQQRLARIVDTLERQFSASQRPAAGPPEAAEPPEAAGPPETVPHTPAVDSVSAFPAPVPPPAYVAPGARERQPEFRASVPVNEPAPAFIPPPSAQPIASQGRASLEHRLGTNWLNRIGIALLVFGVAFFLAYQFNHIGPLGKIISGYLFAAGLLGGSLWLERKPQFRAFARAGIGGGWALLFFTTFAMHYVAATAILSSEFADLLLLFLAAAGMVLHSLRYRSQIVTALAFMLAFGTVTISHQTLYSLLGSAVLALGLEVVCSLEGWYVLEIGGILGAYANHFLWLSRTVHGQLGPGHPFAEFWPSTLVLLLFFIIFRIGYVLRMPRDDRAEALSSVGAVVNAAIVMAVMKYQSFHPQWAFRSLLLFGLLEFAFAFVVRARGRKTAFAVLSTTASVLVLAAIPFRYGGATWPLLWALEGEALWLAGFFTRERALRVMGTLALLLSVAKLAAVDVLPVAVITATNRRGLVMAALLLAAACLWANAEYLSKRLAAHLAAVEAGEQRLGSATAAFAVTLVAWIATGNWTVVCAWSVLALALFAAGVWRRSLSLRLESYAVLAAACMRLLLVDFSEPLARFAGPVDRATAASAIVIVTAVAMAEALRRSKANGSLTCPPAEALWLGGALMSAAGVILSSLLYLELPSQWLAAGWATLALLQTAGALRSDGVRPRLQSALWAAMVVARVVAVNLDQQAWRWWPLWCAAAILFAAVPLAFRLRKRSVAQPLLSRPEQPLFFAPLAIVCFSIVDEFHGGVLTMAVSSLGVLVFLVALALDERSFRLAGLGLLLAGVAKLLAWDVWQMPPAERYLALIVVGISLLAVSFLYSRFADRLKRLL